MLKLIILVCVIALSSPNMVWAQSQIPMGEIIYTLYDGTNTDIYRMTRDGHNVRRMTASVAVDEKPRWSPDGSLILFQSDRGGDFDIFTMLPTGGKPRPVLRRSGNEFDAAWSPDGTQIVFAATPPATTDSYQLMIVNADGTGLRELTPLAAYMGDRSPHWSSDGQWIVYASNRNAPSPTQFHLYLIRPNGTQHTQLTGGKDISDSEPSWSPNSHSIAFTSTRAGDTNIYAIEMDGTNLRRLTDDPAGDFGPVWSPDGSQIAFSSDRTGKVEVFRMNADGSSPIQLTQTEGESTQPNCKW